MAALCNRAGHYIFALWFLSSSSSFFYLFASPNLSGRILDVYHTSIHGVARVRIQNAGLKCAARGSLEIQDAKKSPFWHIRTNLSGYIFGTKACIDNRKKNSLNSNTSATCPDNMVNFGLLTAEICWRVWGKFQQVLCLGSVTARHSSSGRQPNCGVQQRAPPIFGRAAIALGTGPHFQLHLHLCHHTIDLADATNAKETILLQPDNTDHTSIASKMTCSV